MCVGSAEHVDDGIIHTNVFLVCKLQGVQRVTHQVLEVLCKLKVFMGGAKYWVQSTTGLWKIYLDLSFINYYSKEIRMSNTLIYSHKPSVTQWYPI